MDLDITRREEKENEIDFITTYKTGHAPNMKVITNFNLNTSTSKYSAELMTT